MCATNTELQWDVLTIKRPGLTRDLPAGKEELMWVAEIAPESTGHGLPLNKCEAYDRVYDQSFGSH